MTTRQQDILRVIIEEYIKNAEPVGSKKLAGGFDFGIGPAMIRQEMVVLEKEGYLVSPHTSAGRVPTDKAYRFYISQDLKRNRVPDGTRRSPSPLTSREQKKVKDTIKGHQGYDGFLKEISRLTANLSKEFSISGLVGRGHVYTHGLSQLFDEPELQDLDYVSHLMRFMDEIDSYFDKIWEELFVKDMQVFIGRENPVREIQDFSVITSQYHLPARAGQRGQTGFLSIIGPRRMDYKRNMALVQYISRAIDDLAL